jgi:hypothetical protein
MEKLHSPFGANTRIYKDDSTHDYVARIETTNGSQIVSRFTDASKKTKIGRAIQQRVEQAGPDNYNISTIRMHVKGLLENAA